MSPFLEKRMDSMTAYAYFLMIGVPLIVASILTCCFMACFCRRRQEKKDRQALAITLEALAIEVEDSLKASDQRKDSSETLVPQDAN
jgi:hypothetical protein